MKRLILAGVLAISAGAFTVDHKRAIPHTDELACGRSGFIFPGRARRVARRMSRRQALFPRLAARRQSAFATYNAGGCAGGYNTYYVPRQTVVYYGYGSGGG